MTEADGDAWWVGPVVEFRDPVFTEAELRAPLVSPGPSNEPLRKHLDRVGNATGAHDIGGLRTYISRTGV